MVTFLPSTFQSSMKLHSIPPSELVYERDESSRIDSTQLNPPGDHLCDIPFHPSLFLVRLAHDAILLRQHRRRWHFVLIRTPFLICLRLIIHTVTSYFQSSLMWPLSLMTYWLGPHTTYPDCSIQWIIFTFAWITHSFIHRARKDQRYI